MEGVGAGLIGSVAGLGRGLMLGVGSLLKVRLNGRSFGRLVFHLHEIGVRCVPLVLLVGLFTGMVLGLQGYYTLVKFGAETQLGPAVALSLIRELGPVLTALMVVGQAGSALTAELGIQRHSEQIDALQVMGIDPPAFLIAPRLVAALIAFPILTAFFDWMGILGGYITGVWVLHLDGGVYWANLVRAVDGIDVWGGFLKAVVFGVITLLIGCYLGYTADRRGEARGAREVSRGATLAVVYSSVAILATDYLITSFLL